MNERIKELAAQAVSIIPDQVDFDIPDVFKEKFAELIVRECVKVVNDLGSDVLFEHFGVE